MISKARNELRKQEFFHKDYDPKLDEPTQRVINDKIYTVNSKEPDFTPEIEPSINHYLLSLPSLSPKKV